MANYIANITGGDLFELEPVEPYTSDGLDWTNDNSRVSQEYYDESLRDVELVADTVENWDSYDTIFHRLSDLVGHCCLADGWLCRGNDFTGKTVIPFCTSASSGLVGREWRAVIRTGRYWRLAGRNAFRSQCQRSGCTGMAG